MKWFGPDWGAPCCRSTPQILTPEGSCEFCGDPITQGDRGFVMMHGRGTPDAVRFVEGPVHLECFLLHAGVIKDVHVLLHGAALCGLRGLPSDWPDGHRWVGIEDKRRATCAACKRAVDALPG